MRNLLIAGNWKMNCAPQETADLLTGIKSECPNTPEGVEILACPPSISLTTAAKKTADTPIQLGAQNVSPEDNGAFTGEISTQMLNEIDCEYVIVGHSERRKYYGETDIIVNEKTAKILQAGMTPIICVGETLDQREDGVHEKVVNSQVENALENIADDSIENVVIAYEPIWAIGTGETATPKQAEGMHGVIREKIASLYDENASQGVQILYGGSMKPHNAQALLSQPNVDGGLIGGASLKADSFGEIIAIAGGLRG